MTPSPVAALLLPALGLALALAAIARLGRGRGARRLAPGLVVAELLALAGLAVAALLLEHLTDPPLGRGLAWALAAGFFGLLAVHLGGQLLAFRPLLEPAGPGSPRPGRPALVFFLLPWAVYLALLPWSLGSRGLDGDEPYNLLIAHSLLEDGDVDLADEYADASWRRFIDRPLEPQPGDPIGPDGQVYSRHDALLPLVLAPAYGVAGRAGAAAVMATLAAFLAWLTLGLAGRFFPRAPRGALLAYGLVAFTAPLLLYAHQLWVEVPAAVLATLALHRIDALRGVEGTEGRPPGASPWRRAGASQWAGLLVVLVLLPLLKLRLLLVAVPLLVLALGTVGRGRSRGAGGGDAGGQVGGPGEGEGSPGRRSVLGPALGGALILGGALAALLVSNARRYGNPLRIHGFDELALLWEQPSRAVLGALGLFWDPAFGLFGAAPLWLLLVPAGLLLVGRALGWRPGRSPGGPPRADAASRTPGVEEARRFLGTALAAFGLYGLLVVPRVEWYGGWSPPFRYLVIALPVLAVALVPLLERRPRPGARVALAVLGAATLVLTLIWLAVPGLTYDLAHGRSHLIDGLSRALGADAARFFPSYVRPRLASVLWPLVSSALVLGLWWWPARSGPSRRRVGPSRAAVLGVSGLLLAAALVPAAVQRMPSRVVHPEDPWIPKAARGGGHPYPERWTVGRGYYRGGWVLRPGEALEVPLIPGGDRLTVTLVYRFVRNNPDPYSLGARVQGARVQEARVQEARVQADPEAMSEALSEARSEAMTPEGDEGAPGPPASTAVTSAPLLWEPPDHPDGEWQRVTLGELPWYPGGRLVLSGHGPAQALGQNGLLIDRLELAWD